MTTTNRIPARAAIGTTLAAICLTVAACGSAQGSLPDRENRNAGQHVAQHAAADDVVALVALRKGGLTQGTGRQQHAAADDVERWVEQRKSAQSTR